MSTDDLDPFHVVFRSGSVVFDRNIEASTMVKAVKTAEKMTEEDDVLRGFSVYRITRGWGYES